MIEGFCILLSAAGIIYMLWLIHQCLEFQRQQTAAYHREHLRLLQQFVDLQIRQAQQTARPH